MNKNIHILLVEDDINFGSILRDYLKLNDFNVTLCQDGEAGWEAFRKNKDFHLVITDVMMPKKDGFALAKEIRDANRSIPMIFLTAKSLKEDVLKGYRAGADEYLVKPFDADILLHKINAILNRRLVIEENNTEEFTIGSFRFDNQTRSLQNTANTFKLSPKEAELLRLLYVYRNHLLPREKALKDIWDEDNYFTARSMDVYLSRLRKYLRYEPGVSIESVHGKGFKLVMR
jgi:DNA-binding response OmpR family regulator